MSARTRSIIVTSMDVVRPELFVGGTEEALFLTRLGDAMEPDSLTERVRRYVRESEIGKKTACHLLRHAMATLMLEGGTDVRYVQEMLGHTKLETTAIYTHVSITKLREVYMKTHPAARLGRPKGSGRADDAADADAAELLADLEEEAEDEVSQSLQLRRPGRNGVDFDHHAVDEGPGQERQARP